MLDLGRSIPPVAGLPMKYRRSLERELASIGEENALFSCEEVDLIASDWLRLDQWKGDLDARPIIHCVSVKDAIDLIFGVLGPAMHSVVCENVTFGGLLRACERANVRAIGVEIDDVGMSVDALDTALATSGARVIYVIPNKQNPTNGTMTAERKSEIAAIARLYDAFIIEDDIFEHFSDDPISSPIAALAPERTFYLAGTSKSLGFQPKQAWLLAPNRFVSDMEGIERTFVRRRAISTAQAQFSALARSGLLFEIAKWLKREALARFALSREILVASGVTVHCEPGLHIWLPDEHDRAARIFECAKKVGVLLTDPGSIRATNGVSGTRICLGAADSKENLTAAIARLVDILKD